MTATCFMPRSPAPAGGRVSANGTPRRGAPSPDAARGRPSRCRDDGADGRKQRARPARNAVRQSSRPSDSTASTSGSAAMAPRAASSCSAFSNLRLTALMIARACFQGVRGLVGDDAAVRDDDGAGAHLVHLLEDVGGDDDQFLPAQLVDQPPDLVLLVRVEAVGGFVQDEHLWIVDERLGEPDAAPETLGERFDRSAR